MRPATLYAGKYSGGVFTSTNGGGRWSAVNTGLTNGYVTTLAIDRHGAGHALRGNRRRWRFCLQWRHRPGHNQKRFAGPDDCSTKVTYSISVTNSGPNNETSVVTDNLPPEVSFTSCTSSGGGICGGSRNYRTVSFASLLFEIWIPILRTW